MISNCTPTNSPKDTAYRQSEDLKIEKMEKDEIFACYDKLGQILFTEVKIITVEPVRYGKNGKEVKNWKKINGNCGQKDLKVVRVEKTHF
ncbi:hypothetical protein RB195_015169 [Necator americanus]|uniref:Uncharacterized protein n=1 Tax=Necator americanus TaxID=51031 RepID=A0ABR1E3H3_NECAM